MYEAGKCEECGKRKWWRAKVGGHIKSKHGQTLHPSYNLSKREGEFDEVSENVAPKLVGSKYTELENMKNVKRYSGGGLKLGDILRGRVDTSNNQGKVVWQTNVKNAENKYTRRFLEGYMLEVSTSRPESRPT